MHFIVTEKLTITSIIIGNHGTIIVPWLTLRNTLV